MATPRRVYRIYHYLAQHAEELREFNLAMGAKSGTIDLLASKDRGKPLARFCEEMGELIGVLDGTHEDSYLMEATQTFYWASIFAANAGTTWEDLHFEDLRQQAARAGIDSTDELKEAVARLAALPADQVKSDRPFLLWLIGDRLYRRTTAPDKQWSIEQILEKDFQEMRQKPYIQPVLRLVAD